MHENSLVFYSLYSYQEDITTRKKNFVYNCITTMIPAKVILFCMVCLLVCAAKEKKCNISLYCEPIECEDLRDCCYSCEGDIECVVKKCKPCSNKLDASNENGAWNM
ncbi:uncharacterized protein LOC130627610 [Hydractinia symbiolongicarpus]|uniref:uncharacterized protein LOC130627610 n=1 Tax=Hydractinia symbiolongicarpus TaxID=13093 RepID=UPI00254AADED|nr:uncharacterized protein LOC130627610 [Hydractinia symbiolongicarpus]